MSVAEKKLWLFALDPVHVGAGTAHLSHVDLEIVRDPSTRLPKIPATTIAGNARSNADRNYYWDRPDESCAGMGKPASAEELKKRPNLRKKHCGKCPICDAFGTLERDEPSRALTFQDALLLLFPLYSYTHGPLWITSKSGLERFGGAVNLPLAAGDCEAWTAMGQEHAIVLGRRIASKVGKLEVDATKAVFPPLKEILRQGKVVVVDDPIFVRLVSENLEVRTSVAINPFTGAAESGALYRYEALPRTSLLLGSVGIDASEWRHRDKPWDTPEKTLRAGLDPLALTGLGRMGSRGFGRVRYELEEVTP